MPIYEYICTDCDHAHDALQKLSDDPLSDCPACGQSALKKKISAPRFRLSGTGWYETDFKSDKQRNLTDSGKNDAGETKDSSKKDTTKQDSAKKEDKSAVKSTGKEKDAAA